MISTKYIKPILNRTQADVEYARQNQADLIHKNIGAWNYTDMNRICNNLKYAAEYMYEQGFLSKPYSMQVKLDWKETDIISFEELNTMIVNNMNNLKTYSRYDLPWYPILSIANMDHNLANWIERNIDALATQLPIPPDTYKLTITNGSGTGEYEAGTIVSIRANPPETGMAFDHWSGDHLENIGSATAAMTTYEMPHQDISLQANYTGNIPHELKVITYSGTKTIDLRMGENYFIEADPAPSGKVFHHWDIEPITYTDNLYEPAASTYFTMPNENVILNAVYITKGEKQVKVINGNGSGYYEYDTYAAISSKKPINAIFTTWSGDTQYLTAPATTEFNSIKIPDVNVITVRANWTIAPVTGVKLTVVNGKIKETGKTQGAFTQGDKLTLVADPIPDGKLFDGWTQTGDNWIWNEDALITTITVGTQEATITASHRDPEYHKLTVTTNKGTAIDDIEAFQYFEVNANPAPEGQTFDKWTGDTDSFNNEFEYGKFYKLEPVTGTFMGHSDRNIVATYRPINTHTLTIKQLSGDVTYTEAEFTKLRVTAENAPEGMKFTGWSISGQGELASKDKQTTIFTFGNGDTTLTPNYVNIWTITVVGGTIDGKESAVLEEGRSYFLEVKSLQIFERFDGWSQSGPGTISNTASKITRFIVGAGDTTITANITKYPDKKLTVYWRDPDTNVDTKVSESTYTYGTTISKIEAHVAPNKSTFLTWIGDVDLLSPSALASTISIPHLTADTTITATYFYPEAPKYYTLTVYDGYPEEGSYAAGSQVAIQAKTPSQDWEFYKWYGDTQYLVNPDLSLPENAVIMPLKAITLYAKFKMIGELPLYRVSVTNGKASGTYKDAEGTEHIESGVYIDIPAGTEVTLTADPDTVGWVFDYWDGNFESAGVTDIVKTVNPTKFTMVESDLNITMVRRELSKYTVYTTDATGPGQVYPGTYAIAGRLVNTEEYHYEFQNWTCVDADGNDCIQAIANPMSVETEITVTDKDLWIQAVYITSYKLTVVKGQDTGDGYYHESEKVNSISADTPTPESRLQFDHWNDPVHIIQNIYDPTPNIIMKNTVATITAIYTSIDAKGNSVIITGDDIHDELITRHDSYLVNGVYAVGAIVFDKDGCIGTITQVDPDNTDDTDDYKVEKLFYGGNE